MLTIVLCVLAAIWIPGLVILIVSARRAPLGFEDADGFHAVREEPEPEPVHGETVESR